MYSIFWIFGTLIQIQETADSQRGIADTVITFPFGPSLWSSSQSEEKNEKLLSPFGLIVQIIMHFFLGYGRCASDTAETLKDELLRWRAKDNAVHNRDDFVILQIELSTPNSIGLKGLNFFTVTYQFMGVEVPPRKVSKALMADIPLKPCCRKIKALDLVVGYLNVGYYSCFIPFRYKYSNSKHRYEMAQFGPQKRYLWQFVFCVYFLIFGIIQDGFTKLSYTTSNNKDSLVPSSLRTWWYVSVFYTRSVGECTSVLVFSFGWLLKLLCEDLKKEILENKTSYAEAAELKDALLLRSNNKDLQLLGESKDDALRVSILFSEFSSPSIGLKGMNFFTVTYGFLGMLLSQCIVYALIILQLKVGTNPVKN
ncbi:unnamed protein product [Orchesella dallaii]|uniref:Gustatory receptor n=1 Tax=Orchesella dallaii TaxID=48710 RepID=A0ABP1RTC1_9HEXA